MKRKGGCGCSHKAQGRNEVMPGKKSVPMKKGKGKSIAKSKSVVGFGEGGKGSV